MSFNGSALVAGVGGHLVGWTRASHFPKTARPFIDIYLKKSIILTMNGKQVIRILKDQGWEVLRVEGSHHRLGKGPLRTTVPVHAARDLGKGLIKAIERQTGVKLK